MNEYYQVLKDYWSEMYELSKTSGFKQELFLLKEKSSETAEYILKDYVDLQTQVKNTLKERLLTVNLKQFEDVKV